MKVAITVWEDRVSPVFDSAKNLLIAEIEKREIISRYYTVFDPEMPLKLLEILSKHGVGVVICGAVSKEPAGVIESSGVRLIPFIAGNAERILETYANGASLSSDFIMPGCGRRKGCCRFSRPQNMQPGSRSPENSSRQRRGGGMRFPQCSTGDRC